MTIRKTSAVLALAATLTACAPMPYWTLTDDANQVVKSTSFERAVPPGWNRTTTADTWDRLPIDDKEQTVLLERMAASRDGMGIHAITITRRYPDTAFPA